MTKTLRSADQASGTTQTIRLRRPAHRVERRAIVWWTARALLPWTVIIGCSGVGYALAESARPWLGPVIGALIVLGVLNVVTAPTWRYLTHRWEITEEAVYALSGWLVREWKIIPISRIQSIDTVRGPLRRLLGLATLTVTTASRQGSANITGLNDGVAITAAQRLTEITHNTPGDAT